MKVALLFQCTQKGEQIGWGENKKVGNVTLGPVSPKEGHPLYEEMKQFYAATPGGQLAVSTINQAALAEFEPGALYRITIEKVEG